MQGHSFSGRKGASVGALGLFITPLEIFTGISMQESKCCCKCSRLLSFDAFAKDKTKKDGRHTKCKDCVKAYKAERRSEISLQRKEYRAKNADAIRDYMASYRKAYRSKNGQALMAKSIEWARKNPERRKQIAKASRARNAEVSRSITRRRRSIQMGCTGTHTKKDIDALLSLQGWKCACCAASLKRGYHVDHIDPISKGGSNDRLNLQILCPTCNTSKGARDPLIFMQSRGFLC